MLARRAYCGVEGSAATCKGKGHLGKPWRMERKGKKKVEKRRKKRKTGRPRAICGQRYPLPCCKRKKERNAPLLPIE